jgi:hypothetical protein
MKRDFERELEFFNEKDIDAIKRDTLTHNSFLDKTVVVKKVTKTSSKAPTPVNNPPSLDWLR